MLSVCTVQYNDAIKALIYRRSYNPTKTSHLFLKNIKSSGRKFQPVQFFTLFTKSVI